MRLALYFGNTPEYWLNLRTHYDLTMAAEPPTRRSQAHEALPHGLVPTLLLDGVGWKTADDFYNAFLEAVGAPPWHGRNFNALRDSIAGGDINAVGLPYDIVVLGTSKMSEPALAIVERFRELIEELRSAGTRVSIEMQE